jgi:hypothetical protein
MSRRLGIRGFLKGVDSVHEEFLQGFQSFIQGFSAFRSDAQEKDESIQGEAQLMLI